MQVLLYSRVKYSRHLKLLFRSLCGSLLQICDATATFYCNFQHIFATYAEFPACCRDVNARPTLSPKIGPKFGKVDTMINFRLVKNVFYE